MKKHIFEAFFTAKHSPALASLHVEIAISQRGDCSGVGAALVTVLNVGPVTAASSSQLPELAQRAASVVPGCYV